MLHCRSNLYVFFIIIIKPKILFSFFAMVSSCVVAKTSKETNKRTISASNLLRKGIGSNCKTSRDELPPIAIKTILPLLCKQWIVLSTGYITIQRINIRETNCVIRWIEIYPVDSAMHLSNNWGLDYERGLLLPQISLGDQLQKPRQLHDDNTMFCAVGVIPMVSAKQENYFFYIISDQLMPKTRRN